MTRRTLADVRKLSAEMGHVVVDSYVERFDREQDIKEWSFYLHGNDHPSLYKTWRNANRQAFGESAVRHGAVLHLELDRLPLVWTPDDVARVMRRPRIDVDSDDEFEVAERMAVLWMQYAQEVKR